MGPGTTRPLTEWELENIVPKFTKEELFSPPSQEEIDKKKPN